MNIKKIVSTKLGKFFSLILISSLSCFSLNAQLSTIGSGGSRSLCVVSSGTNVKVCKAIPGGGGDMCVSFGYGTPCSDTIVINQ